jgi:hypothetical protein
MTYAGLITWAVVGCLGLLFQATLLFKDQWAAQEPRLQPLLLSLCELANCQIKPYQKADAVVIDHAAIDEVHDAELLSALDKDEPSRSWSFQIDLRNSAPYSVATPWVELTLTDEQDQAVMRQVFDLALWGAPAQLSAGEILSQELKLSLKTSELSFVGYRLLTFYP